MADIAAELRRKKETWFAQRAAAQERENVESELFSVPSLSSARFEPSVSARSAEIRQEDPSPAMEGGRPARLHVNSTTRPFLLCLLR